MPDTTMNDLEAQRNEILLAMQSMAGVEPEPGEVQVGDVIAEAGQELDTPMIVSTIKTAGVVYIYDNRTGERSRTNKNMLPTQLSKRRPDGSLVFTMLKPDSEPARGQLKCLLHPDLRDDHPEYDQWGLVTCNKSNLASRQDVKSHMMMRHKREWATIEDDRIEREKAEDRAIQRETAKATRAALAAAVANGERSGMQTAVLEAPAKKKVS